MVRKGNLISAKISDAAWEIYRRWADERKGSSRISEAIIYFDSDSLDSVSKNREIIELEMNIRGLQKHLQRLYAEVQATSEELSQLYSPQKPQ